MKKITIFFLILAVITAYQTGLDKQAANDHIGTCAHFTSDQQSCLECISHYHLFEGKCYRDIHGCERYIFGSICQKCSKGFILVNNQCCDKHCMARIFKNYQEESTNSQESQQEKIERLGLQGYEKSVSVLINKYVVNSNYQFLSTSSQILLENIRYTIRVMINRVIYTAIADFNMISNQITVLEFRPQSDMSKITEKVIHDKQVVYNQQANKAYQIINAQYGLRIYGYSLEQVLLTKYKYASEYRFIYISEEKQSIFIFTVVVPNRGNAYAVWLEQRQDYSEILKLIEKNEQLLKVEQNPEFQEIKNEVIKTNKVTQTQIIVKYAQQISQNVFEYQYVNKVTGQVFQEKAQINPKSKQIQIISHKEVVSVDLKDMKLPESPLTKIITKQNIPTNQQIKETIRYLQKVQPSIANKQITNAEIQEIGNVHKITLMQKKDDTITRVVVLKDQETDKITLVDQSIVQVSPPTKTIVKTTQTGTKKITTNKIQNLIKMDKNVQTVIQKTKQTLPKIDFNLIEVAERQEGNLINTYTFVVDHDKQKDDDYKHQVVVIQNKDTNQVKVVDVEEIQTKPILDLIQRPVITVPHTEYQTTQIRQIVKTFKEGKPELVNQELIVKSVTKEDKKFVNKYEVLVETKQGQTFTVTANENLGDNSIKITNSKQIIRVQPVQRPSIQKVTVNSKTAVKTTVTTRQQQIKQSFITQKVLEQIKNTQVKPLVSEVVSLQTQSFQTTQIQTVLLNTQKPQQYVQVIYEKPKNSQIVTYIGEEIITIKEGQPIVPVYVTEKITSSKYTQRVESDPIFKVVTQQVTQSEPYLTGLVPSESEIIDHEDFQDIIMVYETPKTNEKQRVFTQYNKITQQVIVKQTTVIPEQVPEIFFEKDIVSSNHVKIVSNQISEIQKQDIHVTTIMSKITEKIPAVQQNLISIQVTETPTSNNYVIMTSDEFNDEIVNIDVIFDKQTEQMSWIDVQQIPKLEVLSGIQPRPKFIITNKEQITKSVAIQNIIPTIQAQTPSTIKQVTKVTETKSTVSTSYNVELLTTEGKKEIVTVLVDNVNPQDITVVDIIPETSQVPSQMIVLTPSKTIVSTDSTGAVKTVSNQKLGFNRYLQVTIQTAVMYQPLLRDQKVICYSEIEYEENIQIVYLAQTIYGMHQIGAFVDKQTMQVDPFELPQRINNALTTVDKQSCDENQEIVVKHNSIALVSSKDSLIQRAIDYILKNNQQVSKVNQVKYQILSHTRVYVIIFVIRTQVVRSVIKYAPNTQFSIVEEPVNIVIQEPTTVEVQTQQDGSTVVSTNDVQNIVKYDSVFPEVIQKVSLQFNTISKGKIINVVSTAYPTNNQYVMTVKTANDQVETIQMIFQKDTKKVVVTQINTQQPKILQFKPRTGLVVPEDQYTSKPVQKILDGIRTNQKILVRPFTPEQVTSITKVDTPFASNYEVVVETPEGPETTIVSYNDETEEFRLIDYQPVIVDRPSLIAPKPIINQFYVEPISGAEVTETNDLTVIQQDQVVKKIRSILVQQKVIEPQSKVVQTMTRKSKTIIQTTVVTQEVANPLSGIAVVTVYNTETGDIKVITEKPVTLSETKHIKISQIFPSKSISNNVYYQVISKDASLKTTIKAVISQNPQLQQIEPTEVVVDKFGHKTITTVTYKDQNIVSIVQTDEDTGLAQIIEVYQRPQNIKPIVYETQVIGETHTTITNSVTKIQEKEPAMPKILSNIKVQVPQLMTQQITGIRLQENNGIQNIYILAKSENKKQIQVSTIYDRSTQQVILMDVQTLTHKDITTKTEETVKVKLSEQQIRQQRIEEIITSTTSITNIPGVQKILSAEERVTGYAKIFDIVVQGTDGQKYVVKTEIAEGEQPQIIDVIQQKTTYETQIFTEKSVDKNTGILFTRTNNISSITQDRYYNKWLNYLENKYQITNKGYKIDEQTVSQLQRTNQYAIKFIKPETDQAQLFRLTVDRTGKITVLQEKTIEKTIETIFQKKSEIQIVQSQVKQAVSKFPVVDSAIKILQNADYTFENRVPSAVYLNKYDTNTEVILMFTSETDPSVKTRVVLMAETQEGASITQKTSIPKILDISNLSEELQSKSTKTVYDMYGRTITKSTDITELNEQQQFSSVVTYSREHLPILLDTQIEETEITQYNFARQYKIKFFNGKDDMQVIVSVNKNGQITLIDFLIKLPKAGVEKIPVKQMQTLKTVLKQEQYIRKDIQTVKTKIITQFSLPEITMKKVVVGENQRVNLYTVDIETPQKTTEQITIIKDRNDDKMRIINRKIVSRPTDSTKTTESVTTKYVEVETSFITQKTNDAVLIKQNPVIDNIRSQLIKINIVEPETQIVETITRTSENNIQTIILTKNPKIVSQNKAIITITDKFTNTVTVVGEKDIATVPEVNINTLDQILQSTVITKQIYEKVKQQNPVVQSVTLQIAQKYPELISEKPETITQTILQDKVFSTVTYPQSKRVTKVTTDTVTMKSVIITEQKITELPKKPIKTTTQFTKQGRKVVTTNNIVQLRTVQPRVTKVVSQLTTNFQITEQSIEQIKSTQTFNGVIFDVLVDEGDNTFTQIQLLSTDDQETIEITDYDTVTSIQIIEKSKQEPITTFQLNVQEVENDQQLQSIVTIIRNDQNLPEITQVTSVSANKNKLTTVYELTTQTSRGQEIVTVTVNRATDETTVIDSRPVRPVQQTNIKQSITKVTVDKVTGIKTTTTNDVRKISIDKIVQKVVQQIHQQYPSYISWEQVSVKREDFPSQRFVQVVILFRNGQQSIQFTALYTINTQQIEIVDVKQIQKAVVGEEQFLPSVYEIIVTKSSWFQAALNRPHLVKVHQYIKANTQFQTIPEKVTIQQYTSEKRYVFVFLVEGQKYQIVAFLNKDTQSIRLIGDYSKVQPREPIIFETVILDNGRKNVVSNNIEQIIKVYENFPDTINQVKQTVQIIQSSIMKVEVQEISTGQMYTVTVQNQQNVEKIEFVRNTKTNSVQIVDQLIEPKPVIISPIPRTGLVVPEDQYTSKPVQKILDGIRTNQKILVRPFTPEQVTSITKVDTPFASNYEVVVETPEGPETTIVSYNDETEEFRLIDYQPVLIVQQPTPKPSITKVYLETSSGLKVEETTDIKLIQKNPVIKEVKKVLIRQSIIPEDSEVIQTQMTTSETKITTKIVAKQPQRTTGKAIMTVYDKVTEEVNLIGYEQVQITPILVEQTHLDQFFPHTVITESVYDEVNEKDQIIQLVVSQINQQHPNLISTKPDTLVIDKIGDKVITTVTYKKDKVVSQIVTDITTKQSEQINTFIVQQKVEPLILQTTTSDTGKVTIVSNNYNQITKIKPEFETVLIKVNEKLPIKNQQIKTISVTENQYTIVTMNNDKQVTQTQFVYLPQESQPILILDHQQITQPSIFDTPKQIVYEFVDQSQPQFIEITEQVQLLNKTNQVLNQNVAQIIKVQKASANMIEQYKTQIITKEGQTGSILIEVIEQKPEVVDIILYSPEDTVQETFEIIQTTNPRTDVVQIVYPTIDMFEIDEGYQTVTQFLQDQTKTHKIQSIVKEKYGQNNEYVVLLKSQQHSPVQVDLNINTFSGDVTLLQKKTLTSKTITEQVMTSELPEVKQLTLSPVEQENVRIISKLSNIKDVQDYVEIKDLRLMEKDEQFVQAINQLKSMYPSLLSASVIVKILKKDSLDEQQWRIFFNSDYQNNIYEAKVLTNRITNENIIKNFFKVGGPEEKVEESDLNISADIAYGYVTLSNFSSDQNIQFILNYLKQHYSSMEDALLQSVQILRLQGRKMNYKLFFKMNDKNVKYIVFYEEEFQRVLHIRSFAFEIGGQFKVVDQKRQLEDPYYRLVDGYAKQNHEQISNGASVVAVQWKPVDRIYTYRTIYHVDGRTFQSSIKIHNQNQQIQEQSWNQIISIPSLKFDPEYIPNEQVIKLSVSDLNSNNKFSEIHTKAKQVYPVLKDAQLIGAVSKSTLSEVSFILYYSSNGQYLSVKGIYNIADHKKIIQQMKQVSLVNGYAGIQEGHGSQQVLKWLQKYNADLNSGVISEIGMKSELMGTLWNILIKLPTKFVRVIILQEGNQYRILDQHDENYREISPVLMPFPQPKIVNTPM